LDKNKLLLLFNEIKSLPILTIGEDAFFVKNGGMVSLQIINGKVSITVNLNAAKSSNLSISARVLKLATVIQ
ncbi:MAG: YfiR family protein, partial [Methylococcales bacterium]|nr:YfiR family protein [Methylococcales bacterium]